MKNKQKILHQLIDEDKCEQEESVRVGMLLSFGIGILNATTYMCRDKVFASTQSGNILYLGLDLAKGDTSHIIKYLFPPLMFALGIIIAEHFHDKPHYEHWRKVPFIIEIVLIVVATFMPSSWNALANPLFGLACGLQSITFRKVRNTSISTVVITSSYYNAIESFTRYFNLKNLEDIFKAFLSLIIVISFFSGVVFGAWISQWIGLYTSLIAAGTLCICPFILTVSSCSLPEKKKISTNS